MVKDLLIELQYLENYGAHNWDGKGECPQHWKNKGGEELVITNVPVDADLESIVDQIRPDFEWAEIGSEQYIIGWDLKECGYLTDFEFDQYEYEGEVRYPAKRIDYNDLKMEIENA